MNNKEVAHEWAHMNRESGKGSHFYFEGRKLYSYGPHFLLGMLHPSSNAGGIALINCQGYSVTTRKHKSFAFGALYSSGWVIIEVPKPEPLNEADHKENLDYLAKEQLDRVQKAPRAREALGRLLEDIEEARDKNLAYVKRFKVAKIAPKFPSLAHTLKAELQVKADHMDAARQDRERLREVRAKAATQERFDAWKKGDESGTLQDFQLFPVALRLSKDGKKIETSRGASVDTFAGVNLWKRWKAGMHLNLEKIGAYTVDYATPEAVKIGCHTITAEEITRFFETELKLTA